MSNNQKSSSRYSTPEILEYVMEYRKIMKELDALKKEIQQVRTRLKPRMSKLTQDKEKYETIILQHLEKQQDPGLKFQDTIIFKEPKKFLPPKKERTHKLTELLSAYNIHDTNFEKEISELMKSKKIIDPSKFNLKMKII